MVIGQMWETGENVTEIGVGIDVSAAAAFDDSVDDRAALAGTGFADEEPVFFPTAVGRMAFSTRLLSISMRPSCR